MRQATICIVMSVNLSVCPHGTTRLLLDGFWWKLICRLFFFETLSRTLEVWLKSDKNNGYFMCRLYYICDNTSLNSSLNKKMFQINVAEKIKIHILSSVQFLRKFCLLWGNVVKYGGARETTNYVTIWRIRVTCWINKSTGAYAHTRAHAPRQRHSRTHTHTRTRTHRIQRSHTRTHARTQTNI